ncbi:MAG: class I SAM-dependent methyltransferase [Thermoleophilaceae bacterium]
MTCPGCGGQAHAWLRAPGSEPADHATYELARCDGCGTAMTIGSEPSPAAYSSGIYAEGSPRLARIIGALRRLEQRLPGKVLARASVPPGARVLDVGAGRGRLVGRLDELGYRAEGIDPSPRGEGVTRATIDEHTALDLDAVVMWHSLEHVSDPAGAIGRAREMLGPNGVLVVAAPNIGSLQARLGGRSWFHLDLPRHRTHFTSAGLRALMSRSRFNPERTYHLVPEHNFYGMWFALLGRLGMTPGFPFHLLKRNVAVTPRDVALLVVAGPLLLIPALLLELLAAALRGGGTIVVVGRLQA